MKVIKSLLLYGCAMVFSSMSISCHRHDIKDDDGDFDEITIVNDWERASEASPEGMAYLFFPIGSDAPWRFDFPGRNAGEVELPEGDYRFVMFNDDTSRVDFTIGSDGDVYASTSICELNALNDSTVYNSERVSREPDMLWCYGIDYIGFHDSFVEYEGKRNNGHQLITHPRQVTPHYVLEVRHVENLHGVVWMAAAITGQSGLIDLNTYRRNNTLVTVPFTLVVAPDSSLSAEFVTLGVPDNREVASNLYFFFLLSDGKMIKAVKDVSTQIEDAPDAMNIELEVDAIELPWAPPAEIGGGGFLPTVNGWVDVVIDYGSN